MDLRVNVLFAQTFFYCKINSHPFQVGKEGGEEVGRGNEEFSSCSGSRDWN